jgi:spore maturation protein CgeB
VPTPVIPEASIRGRYASGEFAAIVAGASVNLGFTHFRGVPGTSSERRQVRLREFEIPAAGGFYLTQDCPQLRQLYRVGEHLDTWSTAPDLIDKIRYYLDKPQLRAAIAARGQDYARTHHTWAARFRDLLADLSMIAPATALSA